MCQYAGRLLRDRRGLVAPDLIDFIHIFPGQVPQEGIMPATNAGTMPEK
jgi:hypothetical protein